jgi:hypothetical protein
MDGEELGIHGLQGGTIDEPLRVLGKA